MKDKKTFPESFFGAQVQVHFKLKELIWKMEKDYPQRIVEMFLRVLQMVKSQVIIIIM